MERTKLLVSDRALIVLPELAKELGVNHAILLQQCFWLCQLKEEKEDGRSFYDNEYWVSYTTQEWHDYVLPWCSLRNVQQILRQLQKDDLLIVEKPNAKDWDQRKWYRVNIQKVTSKFCNIDVAKNVTSMLPVSVTSELQDLPHPSIYKKISKKDLSKETVDARESASPPAPQDEAPQAEKESSPKEDDQDLPQDVEQKKEAQSPETDLSLTSRNLGKQKTKTASQDPETSIDVGTVAIKETNILQFSAMEDQRKNGVSPNGRVRSGHGLVRELIAGATDRVDEFIEWRGARLKATDAYKECSMSPAVVLNFYAKRLPKPWNSEQESAQIMADLKEAIAAEVQQCPSLAKNELKDAKEEILVQIAALYAQDPAKAFELGSKHRLWNEFKRRQQLGQI